MKLADLPTTQTPEDDRTWLSRLPTTQARVAVTLVIAAGTFARYGLSGIAGFPAWAPSDSWLIFIGAMSGLDLASFYAKRTTDHGFVAAKQPQVNVERATVQADDVTLTTQGTTTAKRTDAPTPAADQPDD